MATIEAQVTPQHYTRASAFVLAHLRRAGLTQTSLLPWSIIATLFYTIPLFVIVTAPSGLDSRTTAILRVAVLALLAVPPLFAFGVRRLRSADARALAPIAPTQPEKIVAEATAAGLKVKAGAMSLELPWSVASVLVVDDTFAVIFAPRLAPIPLPREGAGTSEEFFTFLRHAQQYKAASAA